MSRSASAATVEAPRATRLNVNLAPEAAATLDHLSDDLRQSKTELIRLGLGLLSLVVRERQHRHRLAVVSENGKILKEIVLPV